MWFIRGQKSSPALIQAREAVADADRRLEEADRRLRVSEAVKVSLQELRASDYFTPQILPHRREL